MPTMRNVGKITYPGLPSLVSGTGTNLAYFFVFVLEKWLLAEHREVEWEPENWFRGEEHLLLLLRTQCLPNSRSRLSGSL